MAEVSVTTSADSNEPSTDVEEANISQISYSQQYDQVFQQSPLPIKQPLPKPDKDAQGVEPGSSKLLLSDVYAVKKKPLFFNRTFNGVDYTYIATMVLMHGLALLAPFTFSWNNLALFCVSYFITGCLGITLSFHRQLSHRSFQTPKWVEYVLAYCGVLAVQGDPIEWVSSHRCV